MASSTVLDRRRINGPETIPINLATSSRNRITSSSSSSQETDNVQSLFIQTGLVSQASGSAYYESESVKIACSIYGPRQQSQHQNQQQSSTAGAGSSIRSYTNEAELTVDVRFASFSTQIRKRAGKDTESPNLANSVRLALLPSIRLDKLPKATIDIFITILQANAGRGQGELDHEACAAAAATVASCALADAGIELYGLVIGVHGIWDEKKDQIVVDSTHAEAEHAKASLTLCGMPALGTITSLDQTGHLRLDEMEKMLDRLQKASASVHLNAAKAIQQGYKAKHGG